MILVIESRAISYKFARTVKEQLERAECRILGCVLNKVELKNNSYYSKYYGNKKAKDKHSRSGSKERRKEENDDPGEKNGVEETSGKRTAMLEGEEIE